jgi:hypothetical protein
MELKLFWDREEKELLVGAEAKFDGVQLNFSSVPRVTGYGKQVSQTFYAQALDPVVLHGKPFRRNGMSSDRLACLAGMQNIVSHFQEDLLKEMQSDAGLSVDDTWSRPLEAENASKIKFILHCYLSGMDMQSKLNGGSNDWSPVISLPTSFCMRSFRIKPEQP